MPPTWPALEPFTLFKADGSLDEQALHLERARRAQILDTGRRDGVFRSYCIDACRRDPVFFFDQFAWTYDPRIKQRIPMVLWPKQRDFLRLVEACIASGEDFLCEKARDVGVTYLMGGYAICKWRFDPGFKTTFCANKLDLVDEIGNPDSIFEKLRIMLRCLPRWLMPIGFSWIKNARECRLINPENGNVITGEGGDNAGRGGRSTLFVADEAAHIDRADKVNAATSANANTRAWVSSVNGNGNLFYRMRHGGEIEVFTFRWQDDPRKNEAWAKARRAKIGRTAFAQEYDIDYGASVEGIAIPRHWIDAAITLRKRLAEKIPALAEKKADAGMDIGAGKAESVVCVRRGPIVYPPITRLDSDTIDVAHWALDHCRSMNAGSLAYDNVGVGFGISAVVKRAQNLDMAVMGVNTGEPPSDNVWPDERSSKDKFGNLKAELWWIAREAFCRSYDLLRYLDGDPEGIDYPAEEVLLMCDDAELASQLSTPKIERTGSGKIMIESKAKLAARGIKSPDRADAFVLTFASMTRPLFYVGGL